MDLGYLTSGKGAKDLETLVGNLRALGVQTFTCEGLTVQLGPEKAEPLTAEQLVEVEQVSDEELLLDPMAGVKLSRPRRN